MQCIFLKVNIEKHLPKQQGREGFSTKEWPKNKEAIHKGRNTDTMKYWERSKEAPLNNNDVSYLTYQIGEH